MNIHNRWFQLCASLIAMIMIANLQYAWTLFVKPLQAGTGWKLSDIQFAVTLFILFQTWVQPCQGWLIDRMGPRLFISIAGVLCGIGWGGTGLRHQPADAVHAVRAGRHRRGARLRRLHRIGAQMVHRRPRAGVRHHGRGFGGGAALFIPFIASMLQIDGYRATFLWTGVFQGLVILIVAQFLRHPRVEAAAGAAPAAAAGTPAARPRSTSRRPRCCARRSSTCCIAMFVLMATGGLLLTRNAGPIAHRGVSPRARWRWPRRSTPLANGASRVFWGWVSDKIGREPAMVVAFVAAGGLPVPRDRRRPLSGAWFAVTLVLRLFTWGEIYSLFPAMLARLLRHSPCHVELRRGLHRQRRGVDHRRLGGAPDLRTVRHLGGRADTAAPRWRWPPPASLRAPVCGGARAAPRWPFRRPPK